MKQIVDNADIQEISKPRKPQGFAAMSPERRREIASLGGKKAHANGTAHEFQSGSELAKNAGIKGGSAPRISRGRKIPAALPIDLINEDYASKVA